MANVNNKDPFEGGALVEGRTKEEWRELGSAEANAWTITPPGGQPMSLNEHAEMKAKQDLDDDEDVAAMRESMAQEAAERGVPYP